MSKNKQASVSPTYDLFSGQESELARRIREKDWDETPLGSREEWPQSLQTAVNICLSSCFPMVVMWGEELIFLYNDGYKIIAGENHPDALGKPCKDVWPEIWDTVEPLFRLVLEEGQSTWAEDMPLVLHRNNYPEETFFTFSYSPIRDESGDVGGVFATAKETTDEVLTRRRLNIVNSLPAEAESVDSLGGDVTEVLEAHALDVPFSLFYVLNDDEHSLQLIGASGLDVGTEWAPEAVRLSNDSTPWSLATVIADGTPIRIEDLSRTAASIGAGPWPEPPASAVAHPIRNPAGDLPAGVLVLGVSPRRTFDEAYEQFFENIADELAVSLSNIRAYEQERRRAEALAELDRAKTIFFSNVSHELRTPLTLILGPLEQMRDRSEELSREIREELETMYRNGLRLLKLVNNMLEFSRIEAGRTQAQYRPTALDVLTEDLASSFRSAIEHSGITYEVDCPQVSEPIYVDRDMWEKIVLNLLSNALKYTEEGKIEISLEEAPEHVTLKVSDTGQGIPEEEIPHLFERFHRVEDIEGRSHEGSGIGLALVNELTNLHGGSVGVESSYREGSTFSVEIPKGKTHLPAPQVDESRSEARASKESLPYVEEAMRWLPPEDAEDSSAVEEGRENVTVKEHPRGRILFVDDNPDMRTYVRRILRGEYVVETAADGKKALQHIRRREPDLILADIMMPEMNGIALVKALRNDPSTSGLPIILLSARAGEDARIEGLNAGADDYLVKPFNERELKARIDGQLESAREALRRERKLRLEAQEAQERVLTGIRDGFVRLDSDWRYVYVNERAAHLMNRNKEELLGESIWDLHPEASDTRFYQKLHEAVKQNQDINFEYYHPSLDQWIEYWVYPSDEGLTIFEVDITQRKRLEKELLEVSEHEKQEIGKALHDGLGQILTGTAMLCKSLRSKLEDEDPEPLEMANEIQSLLKEARAFNRDLMQGMLPVELEDDELITALDRLIRRLERMFEIEIIPAIDEAVEISDETVVASVYRIVQEAITNAVRHGNASTVTLRLEKQGDTCHLRIADDGKGLSDDGEITEGMGTNLMKHRAHMIGGSLTIESGDQGGTVVELTMPLER